ncbi:MAG: hypothetical protein LBH66_05475 [Oscillospiraceae bacterium]|jgi:hypothetical protein|nr:hypothetical protein [Oscillospiraceae bacterium]
MIAILLCVLLAIVPAFALADAPMGKEFSAAERIIARALADDSPIESTIILPSGLTLRATQTIDRRAFSAETMGARLFTLWQNRGARDITFGTDLIPGESIVQPIGDPRKERMARSRADQLPGLGAILANPLIRFWGETRDALPVWDMAARQWDRLLLLMSPYGSDGSGSTIDGADPIGHCTTYSLDGEAAATVLSEWARLLSEEPQLRWLADSRAMDSPQAEVFAQWFVSLAEKFAGASVSGRMALRVYLDTGDELTAITGGVTLIMDGETLPLSVEYRKKTIGSRVDKTLSVRAAPSSGGDGFRLSLKESLTVDPKGNNKRSINAALEGRLLGESFAASLTANETNAWTLDNGAVSSGAESFRGEGTLAFSTRARERLAVSFNGTGSARFDTDDLINTRIDRATALSVRWIDDERESALADAARDWLRGAFPGWSADGTVEAEISSSVRIAEGMPPAAGISADSIQQFTNLADMDDEDFASLAERLREGWEAVETAIGIVTRR